MTSVYAWSQLKTIIRIDHDRAQLAEKQKSLTTKQQALIDAEKKAAHELRELHTTLKDLQKEIDRSELTLTEIGEKSKLTEKRLTAAESLKEQTALTHEKTLLIEEKNRIEEAAFRALGQYELVEATFEVAQTTLQKAVDARTRAEAAYNESVAALSLAEKTSQSAWEKEISVLPPQLASEYLLLKKRILLPAVALQNDSCSGCFSPLLSQDRAALNPRTLVRCRACYRFLFLPESLAAESELS